MKQMLVLFTIVFLGLADLAQSQVFASDFIADVCAALSEDQNVANDGIKRLRSQGRSAFEKLMGLKQDFAKKPASEKAKLDRVIDQVGGARYSSVSGLYWHTDMDKAFAEAKATRKPILSLRMMGDLREEYSCANSRFFRTTLYANAEISKVLKDQYILHWKSVRPVPKVTIDFGDGRKLERTLTGNSIHYVLTSDGTVIDALPGLYSPNRFLAWVQESRTMAQSFDKFSGQKEQLQDYLKLYHTQKASAIARIWRSDLDAVAAAKEEAAKQEGPENPGQGNPPNPPAALAAGRAIPKMLVELPIIANIVKDARALETQTADATWEQLADRYLDKVELDQSSLDLIRAENPVIPASDSAARQDAAFERLVNAFEKAIAQDTIRNEYLLHFKLHEWFANGAAPQELEKLNERVYAELFLTPREDPWIGLVPPDTYTGLENGGVVLPK